MRRLLTKEARMNIRASEMNILQIIGVIKNLCILFKIESQKSFHHSKQRFRQLMVGTGRDLSYAKEAQMNMLTSEGNRTEKTN